MTGEGGEKATFGRGFAGCMSRWCVVYICGGRLWVWGQALIGWKLGLEVCTRFIWAARTGKSDSSTSLSPEQQLGVERGRGSPEDPPGALPFLAEACRRAFFPCCNLGHHRLPWSRGRRLCPSFTLRPPPTHGHPWDFLPACTS